MSRITVARAVAILAGLLTSGLTDLVSASYQRDIHQARERISAGSQIVETPCGPIEYAVAGSGPPVLVVHGAGGGYDQGLDFSRALVPSGLRVIPMSRFGYLHTPLPADASAAAQADAHACLLDALNISRAAVIGASAGAPSSMQLRYGIRNALPRSFSWLQLSMCRGRGRDADADAGLDRIFVSYRSPLGLPFLGRSPACAPNRDSGNSGYAASRYGECKRR